MNRAIRRRLDLLAPQPLTTEQIADLVARAQARQGEARTSGIEKSRLALLRQARIARRRDLAKGSP